MHVVQGLRQALLMLVIGAAMACAAAGIWYAVQGDDFRTKIGMSLLLAAGLLSLTGGTVLSRKGSSKSRALLGAGPDREEPYTGEGLGAVGVFLFVVLPLGAAGLALLG